MARRRGSNPPPNPPPDDERGFLERLAWEIFCDWDFLSVMGKVLAAAVVAVWVHFFGKDAPQQPEMPVEQAATPVAAPASAPTENLSTWKIQDVRTREEVNQQLAVEFSVCLLGQGLAQRTADIEFWFERTLATTRPLSLRREGQGIVSRFCSSAFILASSIEMREVWRYGISPTDSLAITALPYSWEWWSRPVGTPEWRLLGGVPGTGMTKVVAVYGPFPEVRQAKPMLTSQILSEAWTPVVAGVAADQPSGAPVQALRIEDIRTPRQRERGATVEFAFCLEEVERKRRKSITLRFSRTGEQVRDLPLVREKTEGGDMFFCSRSFVLSSEKAMTEDWVYEIAAAQRADLQEQQPKMVWWTRVRNSGSDWTPIATHHFDVHRSHTFRVTYTMTSPTHSSSGAKPKAKKIKPLATKKESFQIKGLGAI